MTDLSAYQVTGRRITRTDFNSAIDGIETAIDAVPTGGNPLSNNVEDSGTVADGVTNDSAALVTAVDTLYDSAVNDSGTYKGSKNLAIPAGHYIMGSTTVDFTHTLKIEGNSVGQVGGIGTNLQWSSAAVGFRFQSYNTEGDRQISAVNHSSSAGSQVNGMFLYGATGGTTAQHAIDTNVRISVVDSQVYNWSGNGLNVVASAGGGAGTEGNANCFYVSSSAFYGCEDGVYVAGADANAGVFIGVDSSMNRGWGFNDESFLGNTYIGCHCAGNTLGSYRTTNANSSTVLVGCYDEGGTGGPDLAANTLVLGGTWGSGIDTGVWVRASTAGNMVVQPVGGTLEVKPPLGASDITIHAVSNNPSLTFKRDSVIKAGVTYALNAGMSFDMPGGSEKFHFWSGYYAAKVFEIDDTGANLPSGKALYNNGTKVLGAQGAAVADVSGGGTVDTEARAAINALLARCRAHGLIAT